MANNGQKPATPETPVPQHKQLAGQGSVPVSKGSK